MTQRYYEPVRFTNRYPPWFTSYHQDNLSAYLYLRSMMELMGLQSLRSKEIFMEPFNLQSHEVKQLFHDIILDNPMMFRWKLKEIISNCGYVKSIVLDSIYEFSTISEYHEDEVRRIAEELFYELGIKNCHSDHCVIMNVAEWVKDSCIWVKEKLTHTKQEDLFRVSGLLLDHRGVCSSVAATVNVLLNSFGVECYSISGYVNSTPSEELNPDEYLGGNIGIDLREHDLICQSELINHNTNDCLLYYPYSRGSMSKCPDIGYGVYGPESHAWNVVKVNGDYYHVDVTFYMSSSDSHYLHFNYDSSSRTSRMWDSYLRG